MAQNFQTLLLLHAAGSSRFFWGQLQIFHTKVRILTQKCVRTDRFTAAAVYLDHQNCLEKLARPNFLALNHTHTSASIPFFAEEQIYTQSSTRPDFDSSETTPSQDYCLFRKSLSSSIFLKIFCTWSEWPDMANSAPNATVFASIFAWNLLSFS